MVVAYWGPHSDRLGQTLYSVLYLVLDKAPRELGPLQFVKRAWAHPSNTIKLHTMPFSFPLRLDPLPAPSRFPTPPLQQLVEKTPRTASRFSIQRYGWPSPVILGLTKVRMPVSGILGRAGCSSVPSKLPTLNLSAPPKVRMTVPGHPRTSETLVRTSSPRCNWRSNSHFRTRPLLLNHTLGIQ